MANFTTADVVIVNPAVLEQQVYAAAEKAGATITSQWSVFQLCPAPIVGITAPTAKARRPR